MLFFIKHSRFNFIYHFVRCCNNFIWFITITGIIETSTSFKKFYAWGLFWVNPNIKRNIHFRFLSIWFNRLRNKLLTNYLRNRGNDLVTVQISALSVIICQLFHSAICCAETVPHNSKKMYSVKRLFIVFFVFRGC